MEARVTLVMPCKRAFPDLVALASLSTELGDVNICLNVYEKMFIQLYSNFKLAPERYLLTFTNIELRRRPFHGSLSLYF